MKRFPSPRCAFAIQIVRLLESITETQPKLQPSFLRVSATISQYFIRVQLDTKLPTRVSETESAFHRIACSGLNPALMIFSYARQISFLKFVWHFWIA